MAKQDYILVVDDAPIIRETVVEYLRREGYDAAAVSNGAEMRASLRVRQPALVIVDLKLPDEDGFSLTRFLRESCDCGVIMLTARSDQTDRIVGLEIGADDFLSKPHDPRELLARVRSVLRRARPQRQPTQPESSPAPAAQPGGWSFDRDARCAIGAEGRRAELTGAEYNLLAELLGKPGRVLSREHLLQIVYDRPWDYFDRSIDVLVTRLRRKLESAGIESGAIRSIRGVGYTFTRRSDDGRPVAAQQARAS